MTTPEKASVQEPKRVGNWSFTEEGTGPCVVALHGLPGSVKDFRWMAGALKDSDIRFVRVDTPGFGGSAAVEPSPAAIGGAFVDFLDEHIQEPVFLMCHSFGAIYGAEIATRYPSRVLGIIWIAPVGLRMHKGYKAFPNMNALRLGVKVPLVGSRLLEKLSVGMEKAGFRGVTDPELLRLLDCLSHWSWERHKQNIALVTQPSLCVWCDDDPLIEPEIVEEMIEQLGADRLHFAEGGHNPQKFQAVEIAERLKVFIASTTNT